MTLSAMPAELTNWSKSARSACVVYQPVDRAGIAMILAEARMKHQSVIPHGAGHSYTDAALNTGGMVLDVTKMRRIHSWDPACGIMRVEPGVTMREMIQTAWKEGWWPVVSPSTPEVTIGGCAAMNVNGRNAWKFGPFGETILSLDMLFSTGEMRTLDRISDPQLFYAAIGSMGLLGIITSVTIQLQKITSETVTLKRRSAASLDELLALFDEEERRSDFMEAWLDGFAGGGSLGRGHLTSAVLTDSGPATFPPLPAPGDPTAWVENPLVRFAANMGRPVLQPAVQLANQANYWYGGLRRNTMGQQRSLFDYTYWPPAAFVGYHAMFTEGVETFQAFAPYEQARGLYKQLLRFSHKRGLMPLWCVIKRHRRDPYLLGYQVDGFSLELNYQRTRQTSEALKQALQAMTEIVIDAGGRFYLAKDHFLNHAQYRQSIGCDAMDTFIHLKQCYDPEGLLQSDLYRRVFQPNAADGE